MLKKYSVIVILLLGTLLSYVPIVSAETPQIALNTRVAGEFEESKPYETKNFEFTVPEQGLVTFEMEQINHDYRLVLFKDGKRMNIMQASSGEVNIALKQGNYELRLSIDEKTNYAFTINFEQGQYYDAEPNNNRHEAMTILPNEVVHGFEYLDYPFSEDYYVIDVAKSQLLTIEQTNAKLSLYTYDEVTLFSQRNATTKNTQINIKPGKYVIIASGGNYSFSYSFSQVDASKEILPNASFKDANELVSGQTVSGQLSGNQQTADTYKVSLTEDSLVKLMITTDKLNVQLYDEDGELLNSDSYNGNYEVNLRKGNYYIKLKYSLETLYTLTLQTEKVTNVSLEPNNSFEQAQLIRFNQTIGLTTPLSSNHQDYFKVEVQQDGIFKLEQSHRNMSVTLYNAEQQAVAMYNNTLYKEVGVKKGTYYLNINYSKVGQIKPTFTVANVEVEDNDSRLNAQLLPINEKLRGYITHSNDQDVFEIKVREHDVYHFDLETIETSFSHPSLMIMQGDEVMYERNLNDSTKLMVELKPGNYHVIIGGSSSNIYSIKWSNEPAKVFKDVPLTHRYINEISALNKLQVINGYSDGSFKPNDAIKRHHAAAMLVRSKAPNIALGLSYKFFFKDVPRSHPNFESIHKLADAGIVAKSTNGFNPNGKITRAQMAKMIVLAYGLEVKGDVPMFNDVAEDAWYKEYVDILASHGITTGSNGDFKPNEPLTRQHFALFLYRTMQVTS